MLDRVALIERAALAAARLGIAPPMLPAPYFDSWVGLMEARVVMAAVSLGVFDALDERPDDVEGLARRLELRADGVDVLSAALVSLGYLRLRRGRLKPTRAARRWLCSRSPRSLAGWVGSFTYDAWDHLGRLEDVLRTGEHVGLHQRDPFDPYWERYQRGLAELAAMTAEPVARMVPVQRPRRLLDLGGGHGLHACAMCSRHPELHATVVELPAPARIGRRLVADARMASRVEYLEGDLFEIELGEGYDVVTVNSVLHNLSGDRCAELLRRARGALHPGGTVSIFDSERPPPGRPGSRVATLSGVLFHVLDGTRTWTAAELRSHLSAAGFADIAVRRPVALNGTVLVTGIKPSGDLDRMIRSWSGPIGAEQLVRAERLRDE